MLRASLGLDVVVHAVLVREPVGYQGRRRRPGRPCPTEELFSHAPELGLGLVYLGLRLCHRLRIVHRNPLTGFERAAEELLVRRDGILKTAMRALAALALFWRKLGDGARGTIRCCGHGATVPPRSRESERRFAFRRGPTAAQSVSPRDERAPKCPLKCANAEEVMGLEPTTSTLRT